MKIEIEPAAAVMVAALLLTDRTGVAFAALLAAGVHECGHLAAARLLHVSVRTLRFHLLGARLVPSGRTLTYGEEWLLCAAGPLVGLLAAAAAAPFWQAFHLAISFSCASLLLSLLNLLPVRGFDGGRMLETALCRLISPQFADTVLVATTLLSLFLLWLVAVYFLLSAGDGLSLWCFSMSLFSRFFSTLKRENFGE